MDSVIDPQLYGEPEATQPYPTLRSRSEASQAGGSTSPAWPTQIAEDDDRGVDDSLSQCSDAAPSIEELPPILTPTPLPVRRKRRTHAEKLAGQAREKVERQVKKEEAARRKEAARLQKEAKANEKLTWSTDMTAELILSLRGAVEEGMRAQSGFKEETWKRIVAIITSLALPEQKQLVSVDRVKSKYESLKSEWKAWWSAKEQTGWGLTVEGYLEAEPASMEVYFEHHPKARKYTKQSLAMADELTSLFLDVAATGHFARSASEIAADLEDDNASLTTDGETSQQSESDSPLGRRSSTADQLLLRKRAHDNQLKKGGEKKGRPSRTEPLNDSIERIVVALEKGNELAQAPLERANAALWRVVNGVEAFPELTHAEKWQISDRFEEEKIARRWVSLPRAQQLTLMERWLKND